MKTRIPRLPLMVVAVLVGGIGTYALINSLAATTTPAPLGPGGTWNISFDDEFNGTSLDTTKWSTGWFGSGVTGPINTGDELQCYDPSQVVEANGYLSLNLIKQTQTCPTGSGNITQAYKSGIVTTDPKQNTHGTSSGFKYTYGFYEARVYLPAANNGSIANWPAVWADGTGTWPQTGELDVMEGLGGSACWHFHDPSGGPGGCANGNFAGGWHTFGADWEPGKVTYYYDGQNVGTITSGITADPMYLLLNNAVDNTYGDPITTPANMQIDYVRVWSYGGNSTTVPPPTASDLVTSQGFEGGNLNGWNIAGVGDVVPTVVSDQARSGTKSARFVLTGNQGRSELILGGDGSASTAGTYSFKEGDDYYYAFSVYINQMVYGQPGGHNLIFQLKGDDQISPALALQLWNSPGAASDGSPGGKGLWYSGSTLGSDRFISPISEHQWHDIVVHFKVSNKGAGSDQIYLDGKVVRSDTNVNTMPTDTSSAYIKNGIYRNGTTVVGTSDIRIDDAKLGTTYAAVAEPSPPAPPPPTGGCTTVLGASADLQTAINSLHGGDTLCLPAGATYKSSEFDFRQTTGGTSTAPIIITSQDQAHPATIDGRIVFFANNDYITLSWLDLTTTNYTGTAPTLTNGADHTSFLHDDITNNHSEICLNDIDTTDPSYGAAHFTLIDNNRVHDCGKLPSGNQDHGIYESGFNATITNNYIYDNADRGIQLRGAQNAVVEHNVVDGNGEGVIFGDLGPANNKVDHNIFSNSNIRFNVESILPATPADTGNTFTDNCVWSTVGGYYGSNQSIQPDLNGVSVSGLIFADPQYVDRAAHNYALASGSVCKAQAPDSSSSTPPPTDTTAPNAPTSLNATAGNSTTVNLSWTASADTGANQTGVVKYNVLRNGVVIAQPTGTSYTDTGRTANTSYSYMVQAMDGAGNASANSNTASVTTPKAVDTTPPTTPAGLSAAAVSIDQVNLSWTASTDTGGSGLAGYNIYRNGTKLNSSLVTTTSYGDSTAAANTSYSYKVEAVDGSGNKSAQTSAVSANTPPIVRGDITGPAQAPDGKINLQDVSYEIRNYNTSDTTGDVSGPNGTPDGKVDLYDLSYIIRNYGK